MQNNPNQGSLPSGSNSQNTGNVTAANQQQYQARLMQQQLQAMQAAARQQGPGGNGGQNPNTATPQQSAPAANPGQQPNQAATQAQVQALQQLFQNNPERLAQFVNLTKDGKISQEHLNQVCYLLFRRFCSD